VSFFDSTTLFVVGGLVLMLAGIAFLLETVLRRNDAVGRLWSVFYLSAMFAVFAYVVVSFDPEIWWATAAGNGAYVMAIGFIWSGARCANGRGTLLVVPIALGVIVAVAALIPGELGGYWAGAFEMFLGVAITSLLTAFEFVRGGLSRLLASRVITVLVGAMGFYYVARAVAFAVFGPADPTFEIYFGTAASTLVEICFVVLGTIMLASVQGDRFAQLSEDDVEVGARVRIDGMMDARLFREVAETWLLRAIRERATLVLLLIDVADLEAINTAFGRAAGDAAIRTTGRIALTQVPTAALVGQLSARRFALLLELPANDAVEAIAGRIGEAVLGAMIDDRDRFRASTFCGVATTHTSGARYGDLLAAAELAVAMDAKLAQENQRATGVRGS
jgi:diguanylate cyclase (GGDEF)-like protein